MRSSNLIVATAQVAKYALIGFAVLAVIAAPFSAGISLWMAPVALATIWPVVKLRDVALKSAAKSYVTEAAAPTRLSDRDAGDRGVTRGFGQEVTWGHNADRSTPASTRVAGSMSIADGFTPGLSGGPGVGGQSVGGQGAGGAGTGTGSAN